MPQIEHLTAEPAPPELASFFEHYLACYEECDPEGLSAFFAYPCLICDSNGDHFLKDRADVAGYGEPFLKGLQQAALGTITSEVLPGTRPTDGGMFCSTRSKLTAHDGTLIGDMEYHYHLVDEGQGLRIKYASMGKIHYWI